MTHTEKIRCVLYARQSIDQEDGVSQQLQDTSAEAKRRGWTVVDTFSDNYVSGSKERSFKTGWSQMLKAFDDGLFDALIVTETSRLTRRLSDVLEVTEPRRKIRVIAIRENVDSSVDDFFLKQFVLYAEREVKLKSERAKRYAKERHAQGHPGSGRVPHGYNWVPANQRNAEGTRYAINMDEAEDVKYIFSEFLSSTSVSMKQIARDLNLSGRLTRAGKPWGASTVRRILLNPLYAALLPPSQPSSQQFSLEVIKLRDCIPGKWEPIVTPEQIAATRGRLVGTKATHDGTARKWLLSGLAVCSVCHAPVQAASGERTPTPKVDGSPSSSTKAGRYHAYRCPKGGHFMRNGDVIDELVEEFCVARLLEPDAADLIASPESGPDVPLLLSQQDALHKKKSTLLSWFKDDLINEAEVDTALLEIAQTQIEIERQLSAYKQRSPLADAVSSGDVRGWWQKASLTRKRLIIDELMEVQIKPVGHGRRVLNIDQAIPTVEIIWKARHTS